MKYNICSFRTVTGKRTCFCDLRVDAHSNSKVIEDLPNDKVGHLITTCRYATNNCPGKCWARADNAVGLLHNRNLAHLASICRRVGPSGSSGHPIIGYVKMSNCGTFNSRDYHIKLCCYRQEIDVGLPQRIVVDFGKMVTEHSVC